MEIRQSRGGVLAAAETLILIVQIGDGLAVEGPAGIAGVGCHVDAFAAVQVHVIHVADLVAAPALVGDETDLRAVRGDVRVHLVHVRRVGQVGLPGAVRVHDEQLPVRLALGPAVALVHDLVRDRLEIHRFLGQGGRDRFRPRLVRAGRGAEASGRRILRLRGPTERHSEDQQGQLHGSRPPDSTIVVALLCFWSISILRAGPVQEINRLIPSYGRVAVRTIGKLRGRLRCRQRSARRSHSMAPPLMSLRAQRSISCPRIESFVAGLAMT